MFEPFAIDCVIHQVEIERQRLDALADRSEEMLHMIEVFRASGERHVLECAGCNTPIEVGLELNETFFRAEFNLCDEMSCRTNHSSVPSDHVDRADWRSG